MNSNTNSFEPVKTDANDAKKQLEELRSEMEKKSGEPKSDWNVVYSVGELIQVKGYWFKVHHIQDGQLILRPHGATREG